MALSHISDFDDFENGNSEESSNRPSAGPRLNDGDNVSLFEIWTKIKINHLVNLNYVKKLYIGLFFKEYLGLYQP